MIIAIVVAIVAGLAWFIIGASRRVKAAGPDRQLGRMVGDDAAERLIKWEMMRDPKLSRPQAARRALERAEYDRGR